MHQDTLTLIHGPNWWVPLRSRTQLHLVRWTTFPLLKQNFGNLSYLIGIQNFSPQTIIYLPQTRLLKRLSSTWMQRKHPQPILSISTSTFKALPIEPPIHSPYCLCIHRIGRLYNCSKKTYVSNWYAAGWEKPSNFLRISSCWSKSYSFLAKIFSLSASFTKVMVKTFISTFLNITSLLIFHILPMVFLNKLTPMVHLAERLPTKLLRSLIRSSNGVLSSKKIDFFPLTNTTDPTWLLERKHLYCYWLKKSICNNGP